MSATTNSEALKPRSKMPTISNPNASEHTQTLHIGTRRSVLALHQTSIVERALQSLHPTLRLETHAMSTKGDKDQMTALHAQNAKSLWTEELEEQLLDGRLDIIVHSLKDMPTQLPQGCKLGAVLSRGDRRDCVVMSGRAAMQERVADGCKGLEDLKPGEVVGTSSVRRAAQVKRLYPHLKFRDVRGNVGTRLDKLDTEYEDPAENYACLILATAGVQRLGMGDRINGFLSKKEGGMLYAVGQGALGVEIREGDERVEGLLKGLQDWKTRLECEAERSLLRTLEGGCSVPIGVETEWEGSSEGVDRRNREDSIDEGPNDPEFLVTRAIVVSVDGKNAVEGEMRQRVTTLEEANQCGFKMAGQLVEKGAGKILEDILLNRSIIGKQGGA